MKNLLIIEADYNDGDYVTATHYDASDEAIKLCEKIVSVIKNPINGIYYNNWENPLELYKDFLTEDEIENFDGYVPYAPDADTVHSIESIRVIKYESDERIL